jgi:hypothetical protein
MRTDRLKRWNSTGIAAVRLFVLMVGLLLCPQVLGWDGDWTDARSGRTGTFDNPGSTEKTAGTDPPQKYYTAAPRDYIEVDPEEIDDYFHRRNKNYTPYALARITQDLHYNLLTVPKGYYLIKPGDPEDGSPRVKLENLNGPPLPETGIIPVANAPDRVAPQVLSTPRHGMTQLTPAVLSSDPAALPPMAGPQSTGQLTLPPMTGQQATSQASSVQSSPGQASKVKPSPYQVLVIKRQGKVMMVVPIHRRQLYIPARKDKIPNRALAWVEEEDRHPVLKFYFHHWIYSTDFQ